MNFDKIPNNVDLKMSIIDWGGQNNNDFIFLDKLNYKRLNIKSNIIKTLKYQNSLEQYIYIDWKFFFNDIRKSFKNTKQIYNQFKIDLNRSRVYFNKSLIKKPKIFYNYIKNKFGKSISNDIIMLTTQALLGLPFQIIFNNLENNYFIAELDYNSKNKKPYRVSIIETSNTIKFNAYKELRIFKIVNNNPINMYKVFIKLDFNLNYTDNILINFKFSRF